MQRLERLYPAALLIAVLLAGAFLRLDNITYSIQNHPDERHMVMVTQQLNLSNLNPKSFAYGSLSYYLLWITSSVTSLFWAEARSYTSLFVIGRVLCALFGLATVALSYLTARKIYGSAAVGLAAAALLSFNFFHVQLSRFFTSDVILTFFVLLALHSMVAWRSNRRTAYLLLAGVAIGAAVGTKITAVLLAVPLAIALLPPAFSFEAMQRTALRAGLVGLAALVAFIVIEPYAILDFATFWHQTNEQTSMVQGRWRPPYTIQYAHTLPYLYHLEQMFGYTMTWPVFVVVAVGALFSATKLLRGKAMTGEGILVAWVITLFAMTAGFEVKFPRYLLPLYPPLFILAAGLASATAVPPLRENLLRSYAPGQGWFFLKKNVAYLLAGALVVLALLILLAIPGQFFLWLLFLAAALGLLHVISAPKSFYARSFSDRLGTIEPYGLTAVGALTVAVTTWKISHFPLQLHNSEMKTGLIARSFLTVGEGPFQVSSYPEPNLPFYLQSLFMRFAGDGLDGLRLSSALATLIAVIGVFFLSRAVFGARAAFFSSFLYATHQWTLQWGRSGYPTALALAVIPWALFFGYRAQEKSSLKDFGVAGWLSAAGLLLSGIAAPLLPSLLIFWAFAAILKGSKISLKGIGIAVLFFAAAIFPYLLSSRFGLTQLKDFLFPHFIFLERHAAHVRATLGAERPLEVLAIQFQQLASFLLFGGDKSLEYGNASSRLVDPLLLIPVMFGVGLSFTRSRFKSNLLLLVWLCLSVLTGAVLSIDAPFAPRLAGLTPIVVILEAWVLALLFEKSRTVAVLLSAGAVFLNAKAFFVDYPASRPPERRDYINELLRENPDVRTVLNLSVQPENFAYESYRFNRPTLVGKNRNEVQNLQLEITQNPFAILVISDEESPMLTELAPHIKSIRLGRVPGRPGFLWYILP